jgi:pyrimidine oxygenase
VLPSKPESHHIEIGVFLPVFNGGWIMSSTSPKLSGSYAENLAITLLAQEMGLDFALSAAAWRGYDGPTRSAQYSLESMMCMAGLAQATSRIKIWTTVHMMIWPPAIVAKMVATLDQIAGARIGLNVVTGSNPKIMQQMGLWRELNHDERYAMGEEWVSLVRRLWTQERVTHKGRFYETDDCMSFPKPSTMPTLICAGMSDRGFRFTAQHCDIAFMTAQDDEKFVSRALQAKKIAVELGRPGLRTFGLFSLIPGATDREAREKLELYNAGVDRVGVLQQMSEYAADASAKHNEGAQVFLDQGKQLSAVMPNTMAGSPETLARRVAWAVRQGSLDGLMVIVPDFDSDLRCFGREIVPMMAEHGISTNATCQES